MSSSITIRNLTDGGQQPAEIAHEVAAFVAAARQTLDLAQYDFHLGEETAATVCGSLKDAAAWTGSTNWTDDSWSRQENVVVVVESSDIAKAFALDFDGLWQDGDVERSGFVEPRPVDVDGITVRPWFTPGFADALTHRIAKKIGHAQKVRICSPVITSAPVLATLAQRVADGSGDIAGCVDATQVEDVIRQWRENGSVAWKIPLLQEVLGGHFTGKDSTP